jgi:serine protease Do
MHQQTHQPAGNRPNRVVLGRDRTRSFLHRSGDRGSQHQRVTYLALALFLLAVCGLSPASSGQSPMTAQAKNAYELQPGVVLIDVRYTASLAGGKLSCPMESMGSGFLYRPDGYLVTNAHVVESANRNDNTAAIERVNDVRECLRKKMVAVDVQLLGREPTEEQAKELVAQILGNISVNTVKITNISLNVYLDNGHGFPAEIKQYSPPLGDGGGKDIAILKITDPAGKPFPTVAVGDSDELRVGDPITVIGYPGGSTKAVGSLLSNPSIFVPSVTSGKISAVNKSDARGIPLIQSEAAISHGNSGGPAFDDSGAVIGMSTYGLEDANNINFFIPIKFVREFIAAAGPPPSRGPFDKVWNEAVEAYGDQRWELAHERAGQALEMMPDQPDAMNVQLWSSQQIAKMNPLDRFMAFLRDLGWPVIAGILVLLAAVFLFLLLGGKSKIKPIASGRISPPTPVSPKQSPGPIPGQGPAPAVGLIKDPNGLGVQRAPSGSTNGSYGTLHVTNGPLAGNRFTIPKEGILIGRDAVRCKLVLDNQTASKEHAWAVPLEDGVNLIDQGSSNGTYVNSTDSPRIRKVPLKSGDRIFIGKDNPTEITYFA